MKINTFTSLFSRRGKAGIATAAFLISASAIPVLVLAAPNTQLTQTIGAGTLVTDIRDQNGASVASPSVTMSAVPFPFECLTAGAAPTGNLGTNTQRLYVDNPGAANNGWTLTLAATAGASALWQNGSSTQNYDFNDPTTGGCDDGADGDSVAGQLSVDPSSGTAVLTAESGTNGNITQGAASAFSQGATDSITLLNAAAGSDDYGRWYLTDVGLRQTIPAEQAADSYSLNLTLTVTAQ
jgi:hypothetical protein